MIAIDREGRFVLATLRGRIDFDHFVRATEAMFAHPDYVDGMNTLWDFRQADLAGFTHQFLHKAFTSFVPRLSRPGRRVAFVTERTVDFGILRMYQVHVEARFPQHFQVFRDFDAALAWISDGARALQDAKAAIPDS